MKRFVLIALFALWASRAEAQLRGGFGMGFGSLACEGAFSCGGGFQDGAPMSVSVFGYLADQVSTRTVSGVELGFWIRDGATFKRRMATASWIVLVRPWPTAGLRLKGGLGLSTRSYTGGNEIIISHRVWGTALTLGTGYEIPAFRRASFALGFNLVAIGPMENPFNDGRYTWQVTFGVIPH